MGSGLTLIQHELRMNMKRPYLQICSRTQVRLTKGSAYFEKRVKIQSSCACPGLGPTNAIISTAGAHKALEGA